jgi:ATP-binding cassette, subfamily B, multidrug efflux pump
MFNPYIAGKIIDKIIYGHQNDLLWPLLGLMIGVTITKTVIRYRYQLMFERIAKCNIYDKGRAVYSSSPIGF